MNLVILYRRNERVLILWNNLVVLIYVVNENRINQDNSFDIE